MIQDEKLIKFVTSRQQLLERERQYYDNRLQDKADYVCVHRDDIRGTLGKGLQKAAEVYDGTAISAAVLATSGIHGYHISPSFPWFTYMLNRKEANQVKEAKEWLQEEEFNIYTALNRSNFYSEMWGFIYDGFTMGIAASYLEEDIESGRIICEALHPGEFYLADNAFGEVDVLHRKRKQTAKQIVDRFGIGNCPDIIKNSFENNPFYEFEVVHAVFPRKDYGKDSYDSSKRDAKNKKYASVWLTTAGGNHLCGVSGFDEFPYFVWRYLKTGKGAHDVICPSDIAMPSIKTANLMGKELLGAAQLHNSPALMVPAYLMELVDLSPEGKTPYREGSTDRIEPIRNQGNYPVGADREKIIQAFIRESFKVDTFLMLASLEGRGQRTAYEVSEMQAEKAAILGAELGPLNGVLDRMIEKFRTIETNANRMPQPPDVLLEMAEQDPNLRFDPVYMGPLAQAQREKFAKDGIRKFFMDIAPVAQLKPEVLDNIDEDKVCRLYGDANRVPQEIFRDQIEVDSIRQGRMQAQQQMAMAEGLNEAMAGLKTATEADANTGGKLSAALASGMIQ